tara:strand:+ start:479 stop:682 length:204 start_codon:yes stop_codon:yes gene_type:complete
MSLCSSPFHFSGLIGAVFAGIGIFYRSINAAVLTECKAGGLLIGIEVHRAVKTPQLGTFTSFFAESS